MEKKNDDLKDILSDAVSEEFAHIPTDEDSIDFEFSEDFQKKMTKMLRRQKKSYYPLISTAARRVAIICLCCALMFSMAIGVDAVRDSIQDASNVFIPGITSKYLYFDPDPTLSMDLEYEITWLPEGFELVSVQESTASLYRALSRTYSNGQTTIQLRQTVYTSCTRLNVLLKDLVEVGGMDVRMVISQEECDCTWVDDDKYVLWLTVDQPLEQETLVKIIESVLPVEE